MEVSFWGTRGSLPAPVTAQIIRHKVKKALEIAAAENLDAGTDIDNLIDTKLPFWVKGTYGSNTSCVEIRDNEDFLLCDAGSGLREFGYHFLSSHKGSSPKEFHIFISHPHWDHIQGFPFFIPSYIDGTRITIYGCHDNLKESFSLQQRSPFFPVDFDSLGAKIDFVGLEPGKTYDIAGFSVSAMEQNHPGISFGYRFVKNGKTIVYSTDSEHNMASGNNEELVTFFNQADLLIFDAQYTLIDAWTSKEDWGHSNNLIGVELAQKAHVKHLCLFHNDPVSSDQDLDKLLHNTTKLASLLEEGKTPRVSVAYDGMIVEV